MAPTAGNHEYMPDCVEMTDSFVVDEKSKTRDVAGDTNEDPPQRINGYHSKQCWY